jgi:hypothetical protein
LTRSLPNDQFAAIAAALCAYAARFSNACFRTPSISWDRAEVQ